MKYLFLAFLAATILVSCQKGSEKIDLPAGYRYGIVQEKTDAQRYSYIKVEENGKTLWIASRRINAKNGDTIYYSKFYPMKNFESKALNKTFDLIYFVEDLSLDKPTASARREKNPHPKIELGGKINVKIEPLPDGYTIKEIYEKKAELKGKKIKIRGKVTKFNPSIMNRNWIHIQDGTEYKGKFEITVTSQDVANVGDVAVIEGVLATDKDFGAGYVYDAIIEYAKIKRQSSSSGKSVQL